MVTTRMTLIAVAVFAVLATLVIALERQREPGSDEPFPPLVTFKPADVDRLVLQKGGETITAVQESPGKWQVEGIVVKPTPTPTPAPGAKSVPGFVQITPAGRVENLVRQVTSWKVDRVLGPLGDQLTEFGLDQPALRLELATRRGTHTLVFGAQTANESAYYVLRQEKGDVVLISRFDFEAALRQVDELLKEKAASAESG